MTRIAIALEYDGKAFLGWQSQPHGQSVQDVLEHALMRLGGKPIRAHAAGRTDAGVHASKQIAHFDVDVNRPITAWVRGVNSFLPDGLAVLWAREVPETFHARFSAMARHYRYILLNHSVRPGIQAGKIGWHHTPLNVENMQAAANHLLGEHDFSSFRAADCQAKSPIKVMHQFDLQRVGDLIICDTSASGYLHHMVRNIMGTLVHIGKGAQPPEYMKQLIAVRNRTIAPPTFMPDGLYFTGVTYPDSFDLDTLPTFRHGLI
ncbi:tRNA pseudouridine(38-40) synthase TruA [Burkholderiaceae bacterium DAT-1]|nr:tRNA pseudouridine(38-40) synthase TruA [Burkholderiaceae bacterium DAT-1]